MPGDAAFDPDNRALYSALFRAPEGYAFDCAAATTYSLDFETTLAVLLAIAADDTVERDKALAQPLALLRAVQRLSGRITIHCDRGRILRAPARIAPLMALCERMIVEVAAPGGGAFHPKIWCVRFTTEDAGEPDRLRLAVLSRNLTPDRSWDLSLVLDGVVGRKADPRNAPLVALMKALPGLSIGGPNERGQGADVNPSVVHSLARCDWELPLGAKTLTFAVNGISGAGSGFGVSEGDRLAVVSPFLSAPALEMLVGGLREDAQCHLISRVMALDALPVGALAPFETVQTLDDALVDDSEGESAQDWHGAAALHAKAVVVETGRKVSISVGSANATGAALLPAKGITLNVEVMATLSGTIHKMGGIDDILLCDSFSAMLDDYTQPADPPGEDDHAAAESLLEEARKAVAALRLDLHSIAEKRENVTLILNLADGCEGCTLPDGVRCFMCMLAAENTAGIDAASLLAGETLPLGGIALSGLTRWIGVRLRHEATGLGCAFTLGANLIDPPAGREAAALRAIIEANDFLSYIALLLGESEDGGAWEPGVEGAEGRGGCMIFEENDAVLEPMVRALCRGGGELAEIDRLLEALRDPETGESTAPEDFLNLWQAFAPLARKGKT